LGCWGVGIKNTLAYSKDGIYWNGLGLNVFTMCNAITYSSSANVWVAGGSASGVCIVAYSYDGIKWTNTNIGLSGTVCISAVYDGSYVSVISNATSGSNFGYS